MHALETEGDQASARVHALREVVLAHSREVGEWEARWARAEQTRRELEATLEQRTLEAGQSRVAISEIEAQTAGLRNGLDGLRVSESDQQQRVVELKRRYQSDKETVAAGEDESRRVRFEQQELSELLHQIELDRVQKRAELDRTFERLRTEYEMDPAQWSPEPPPADFDLDDAARDLEESRQRLREAGRRKSLGARGLQQEARALPVPDAPARGPAAGQGPAARGDREDQRHREPAVRRDVREGAGPLPRHLPHAVRGRRRRSCGRSERTRSTTRSRSSPSRAASTCRASA